jgi:hypothetical protein
LIGLLWVLLSASAGEVELSLSRWLQLLPEVPVDTALDRSAWWADTRDVTLTVDADLVRVRATWRLEVAEPGWVALEPITDTVRRAEVRVDGAPVPTEPGAAGVRVVIWLDGPAMLTLDADVPRNPGNPVVHLFGATRGRVQLADDLVLGASLRLEGAWISTATELQIFPKPSVIARAAVSRLTADVGLTASDREILGRARLRWQVLLGQVDQFRITTTGLSADAELTGSGMTASRAGDTWTITLDEPTDGRVDLFLRWSLARTADDEQTVPVLRVSSPDARVEQRLAVARDTDLEVVPRLTGAQSIPLAQAADAVGLLEGAASAAWSGQPDGTLSLLRYEPAEQPALIVDVADWWVASAVEGRRLVRGVLTLRNERAAGLSFDLPASARVLAVRVDDVPVTLRPTDDGVRVSVPRSVESVMGPIAFPVEIVYLEDDVPWTPGKDAAVTLPAVDAPVAVSRVRLGLPKHWREVGKKDRARVDDFDAGATVAYGFGDGAKGAEAEAAYRSAVQAWMRNDFQAAQAELDSLAQSGMSNDNVLRLQSNLDLVSGRLDDDAADGAAARRVREQAYARAEEDRRVQEEVLREAERKAEEGKDEEAEVLYGQALELSDQLALVEQSESVEQVAIAKKARSGLRKAKRDKASAEAVAPSFDESGEVVLSRDEIRIVDAAGPTPDEVLTEEYLRSIPAGRSYQSAVSVVAGVSGGSNPNVGGSETTTVMIDGVPTVVEAHNATRAPDTSALDDEIVEPIARAGASERQAPVRDRQTVIDFESDDIEGELVRPQGALLMDVPSRARTEAEKGEEVEEAQSLRAEVGVVTVQRGRSRRGRGRGSAKALPPPPPPPVAEPAPSDEPPSPKPASAPAPSEPPLDLTVTEATVILPPGGDTVRFQQLLLAPGTPTVVRLRARPSPGSSR